MERTITTDEVDSIAKSILGSSYGKADYESTCEIFRRHGFKVELPPPPEPKIIPHDELTEREKDLIHTIFNAFHNVYRSSDVEWLWMGRLKEFFSPTIVENLYPKEG